MSVIVHTLKECQGDVTIVVNLVELIVRDTLFIMVENNFFNLNSSKSLLLVLPKSAKILSLCF